MTMTKNVSTKVVEFGGGHLVMDDLDLKTLSLIPQFLYELCPIQLPATKLLVSA